MCLQKQVDSVLKRSGPGMLSTSPGGHVSIDFAGAGGGARRQQSWWRLGRTVMKVKVDQEEDVRVCSFKLCVQHLGQSLTAALRVGPGCD
ncbi:hypothetical protein D4764_05G0014210 [Takifugu flavidus]|uniref:Uncharacterized protein n=1 Tax=Takifugu flavidus TaxID=433684 RepID=A0A5C6N4U8_9TELE|nr:hypothetical protein D4764_05G0014210 [Takifugu flavidus]